MPITVAMATTRLLESGGDYTAQAAGSSASGAYQVIDSTWAGYGGYARAVLAPPAVQDRFAFERFVAILERYDNDVSAIPLAWYYPRALTNPALMDVVPVPEAGNVLTPRQYQARWMRTFQKLLIEGSPASLPANDPEQPLIRSIAFPVLGPVEFIDDWHFPRDGGRRRHEGNDLIGTAGQPLRAAVDGVVTRLRHENVGTAGVVVSITDPDGYRYNFFHLNDDGPDGTGTARAEFRIHPALTVGSRVERGPDHRLHGRHGQRHGDPTPPLRDP